MAERETKMTDKQPSIVVMNASAGEMLRVKNLVPAIGIEGFEEATDFRRGSGTYQKVIGAMKRLKARKQLFGISCCYTSKNVEVTGSGGIPADLRAVSHNGHEYFGCMLTAISYRGRYRAGGHADLLRRVSFL